ncbi:hypothetical protein MMC17_005065 [Xylographa soralifera]|nr:hypothetical protein [Xylographa soralifera]
MPEPAFLTTKTERWNHRMPLTPPQWTNLGDGFDLDFEADETVPLTIINHLGAQVDKSKCMQTGEIVAVKRLSTYSNSDTNEILYNEVKVLRDLKHDHCIQVLGCYTHKDYFNIVTQPVADCDLNHYLTHKTSQAVTSMEKKRARATVLPRIMGCLAYTLHYIHKEPRVRHRDIKPENILLYGSRVLYADFGLSKTFTETQSGTSGPSAKTLMYTSPERAADLHRNKKDDIFSLGCVLSVIFTVCKGETMENFRNYRKEQDPEKEKEGYFFRTVPAVIVWLEKLATERSDVQIVRLLRSMLDKPDRRPDAEHVWKVLTTCTTGERIVFCGPCCMLHVHDDPFLTNNPEIDLSEAMYDSDSSMARVARVSTDLYFDKQYGNTQQLDLYWIRNLRHWSHSILDVVKDGEHFNLLARKRLQASDDVELDASIYA